MFSCPTVNENKKAHWGQLSSAGRVYVRTAEVVGMTEQPKNRRRQDEVIKYGMVGKERQQRRGESMKMKL